MKHFTQRAELLLGIIQRMCTKNRRPMKVYARRGRCCWNYFAESNVVFCYGRTEPVVSDRAYLVLYPWEEERYKCEHSFKNYFQTLSYMYIYDESLEMKTENDTYTDKKIIPELKLNIHRNFFCACIKILRNKSATAQQFVLCPFTTVLNSVQCIQIREKIDILTLSKCVHVCSRQHCIVVLEGRYKFIRNTAKLLW